MPILNSCCCCCCRSLRSGSYAAAIYTLIFYTIIMTVCSVHVHTVLNAPDILALTLLLLVLSSLCVISSVLLLVGLCTNNKYLLLPWMGAVSMITILDLVLSVYLIGDAAEDPFLGVFLVIDYIVCGLNVYCLLCVVSHFQEYLTGRGHSGQRTRREPPILQVHQTMSVDDSRLHNCAKLSFISSSGGDSLHPLLTSDACPSPSCSFSSTPMCTSSTLHQPLEEEATEEDSIPALPKPTALAEDETIKIRCFRKKPANRTDSDASTAELCWTAPTE